MVYSYMKQIGIDDLIIQGFLFLRGLWKRVKFNLKKYLTKCFLRKNVYIVQKIT